MPAAAAKLWLCCRKRHRCSAQGAATLAAGRCARGMSSGCTGSDVSSFPVLVGHDECRAERRHTPGHGSGKGLAPVLALSLALVPHSLFDQLAWVWTIPLHMAAACSTCCHPLPRPAKALVPLCRHDVCCAGSRRRRLQQTLRHLRLRMAMPRCARKAGLHPGRQAAVRGCTAWSRAPIASN